MATDVAAGVTGLSGNVGCGVGVGVTGVVCATYERCECAVGSSGRLSVDYAVPVFNLIEVSNRATNGTAGVGDCAAIMASEYNLASWLSNCSVVECGALAVYVGRDVPGCSDTDESLWSAALGMCVAAAMVVLNAMGNAADAVVAVCTVYVVGVSRAADVL